MVIYVSVFAAILVLLGDFSYIRGIIKGSIIPTKSTWIIFSIVTALNVSSFLTVKFDVVSGLYSISDFFLCVLILITALVCSRKEKIVFKTFEKYYLAGAFICLMFWLAFSNPFITNLLAQSLIAIGYIPTMHNLIVTKEPHESKFVWMIWVMGSVLAMYPAVANQNLLAVIYSARAIVMCSAMLILILIYQKKSG